MWRTLIVIGLMCLIPLTTRASNEGDIQPVDTSSIRDTVLALHRSPNGRFMIWNECGKVVRGDDVIPRADRYSELIDRSIQDVKAKTGFEVPYRDVVAVLFRESSHNECCVGKQEVNRLAKVLGHVPEKEDLISNVRGWYKAQEASTKWCQKNGWISTCKADYIAKNYPQYANITRGWDLGAAQYRFPNAYLHQRIVTVPITGKVIEDIGVSDLMQLDVAIQLLVEDLARYHGICKGHEHWLLSKWGRKMRVLSVDEAYYVHHHMGQSGWSWTYWEQMQRHFRVIDSMKQVSSTIISRLSKILFGKLT